MFKRKNVKETAIERLKRIWAERLADHQKRGKNPVKTYTLQELHEYAASRGLSVSSRATGDTSGQILDQQPDSTSNTP